MKSYYSLYPECQGKYYSFLKVFGFTIVTTKHKSRNPKLNNKIIEQLSVIENPFLSRSIDTPPLQDSPTISISVRMYAFLLIWLYKYFYPGLWLVSHLRLCIFKDAVEACDVFYKIHPQMQNILCLPRSIFAATTSRQFVKHGIMVIGGFLPSHNMHAWVMEKGKNSWREDKIWINYTPVSIMS